MNLGGDGLHLAKARPFLGKNVAEPSPIAHTGCFFYMNNNFSILEFRLKQIRNEETCKSEVMLHVRIE